MMQSLPHRQPLDPDDRQTRTTLQTASFFSRSRKEQAKEVLASSSIHVGRDRVVNGRCHVSVSALCAVAGRSTLRCSGAGISSEHGARERAHNVTATTCSTIVEFAYGESSWILFIIASRINKLGVVIVDD